jgi:hypothetical protein
VWGILASSGVVWRVRNPLFLKGVLNLCSTYYKKRTKDSVMTQNKVWPRHESEKDARLIRLVKVGLQMENVLRTQCDFSSSNGEADPETM